MYDSITTDDLRELIGRINIIDIRSNYLYRLGYIPTSKNVPSNYLTMNPDIYLSKENTYYIYCSSGMSSPKVCSILASLGYKVVNVLGGYNDYASNL
jgi:rhodanese-related sulfurtransferase